MRSRYVSIRVMAVLIAAGLVVGLSSASGAASTRDNPGGELSGKWRQEGAAPVPVVFSFHREREGEGRVSTRLGPEGERFVGEYLRLTGDRPKAKITRYFTAWNSEVFDDFTNGPSGQPWVRSTTTIELFRDRHRGSVVATLIGNRGGRMRCRLDLLDATMGLSGGATGRCQLSTGSTIEIR